MKPKIVWGAETQTPLVKPDGGILVIRRKAGTVALSFPRGEFRPDKVCDWAGRTNREAVQFANHIALPETLLWEKAEIEGNATRDAWQVKITFLDNLTPGRCEDNIVRRVGWNRVLQWPTRRWTRTCPLIYALAEDVDPRGFAALWS